MSAPVISGADAITEAERVLAEADSYLFLTGGARVLEHADWLRDDLATYEGLLRDPCDTSYLHPATVFPELAGPPDHALREALESATKDVLYGTRILALVIAETAEASS